jgi:exopolyphosphatase/guanosine-5'-triphosphate,3'-diphosphate pyrophosphatase
VSGAVAAIDCGTNSTRLLVSAPDGTTLARLMQITRLGQGVDRTHRLAPDAIARTVAVLEDYRRVMDRHGVGAVRMTATSAARDASNRDEFFAAAERAVGAAPELLDGFGEATLSFAGATAELDASDGPWLVADVGGGSTELAIGPSPDPGAGRLVPIAARSLDIGCVRITERFLASDPPGPAELRAAVAHVDGLLVDLSASEPAFATTTAGRLVGLAGTVSALASLDQGLTSYDRDRVHHYVLTREAVDGLLGSLSTQTVAERLARPGMEPARADVIVGGTIVVSALLRHFGLEACLVSEADILDGLTMSLLASS